MERRLFHFVENFTESRPVSRHFGRVDLTKVNAGQQLASWFRASYRDTSVDLVQLAAIVQERAWAPIRWRLGACLSENFIDSHWMALDFDETDYTLAQALGDWSDSVHVIGTTKSHGIPKDKKPAKDRFRIIVPWAEPILCAKTYAYNLERLIASHGADATCSDPARFFWPCREIISVNRSGYLQPVKPYAEPERLAVNSEQLAELRRDVFGRALPVWIADFVNRGKLPPFQKLNGSRKWACFAAAAKLRDLGWQVGDTANLIHAAPFDRANFDDDEIDAAVKSAFKRGRA